MKKKFDPSVVGHTLTMNKQKNIALIAHDYGKRLKELNKI